MHKPHWINNIAQLHTAFYAWKKRDWLSIDTEFLRIDTYFPKLCLVQVGDGENAYLIDVLAFNDLSPLFERLLAPELTSVFHAAGQDLEIYVNLSGRCPAKLFDTQIAAALLGLGDQLGYGGLIEKRLGIVLDKSLSRTDWSRRPLTRPELEYAAADVTHLNTIYPQLRAELIDLGRLAWLEEDAENAIKAEHYITQPANAWQRLKGLARISPQAQQAAAGITAWREVEAQAKNRPRSWIIDDEAVYRIAERMPTTLQQLKNLAVLPQKAFDNYGQGLLELLSRLTPNQTPLVADQRLSPEQKIRFERLRSIVNSTAEKLNVPSSLLAPRYELEALLGQGEQAKVRALTGWRRTIIGNALLAGL